MRNQHKFMKTSFTLLWSSSATTHDIKISYLKWAESKREERKKKIFEFLWKQHILPLYQDMT